MYECNMCGKLVEKFTPYRGGSSAISELQNKLKIIGSDIDNFSCPHCGCHDRERHLKLYIEKLGILDNKKNIKILHFAPENNLLNFLSKFNPEIHILADLNTSDPRFEKINIEAIPYGDKLFDLVIANHILEHVNNPDLALSEINRVLKDDGLAILQTPYSQFLEKTFEDEAIKDPENRLFFYGQEDHVRIFGRDIFEKMNKFLSNKSVKHVDIFEESSDKNFGINELEPFFLFGRRTFPNEKLEKNSFSIKKQFPENSQPEVSICCITYNHEEFIEKTINSFLNQKTTFKFEIIVGEDGGTDKTRTILEQLSKNHPGCIRLLPADSNMGMNRNFMRTIAACSGRYVALCEGDDYWSDCEKLQKQWQYLENNLDCVVVQSNVQGVRDGKVDLNYVGGVKSDFTNAQLMVCTPMNSLTVMFRNVLKKLPQEILAAGHCDLFVWSLLGHYGSSHYMQSILPSIYNIHDGGVHSNKSQAEKIFMRMKTSYALYMYYSRIEGHILSKYFLNAVEKDYFIIKDNTEVIDKLIKLTEAVLKSVGNDFIVNLKPLQEIISIKN